MKRLLAVLLSVAMIFVFAACNNTNEPSDENQGENNTGDTSAAELVIGGIAHCNRRRRIIRHSST